MFLCRVPRRALSLFPFTFYLFLTAENAEVLRRRRKEYRRFNSIYLYKINTCELITYESRKGFNVNRAAWNAAVDSTFVIINRKAVEYCFFILIQALQACWLWLRLFATIDFIDGYLILSPSGLCCVIAYTKSKIRMFRSEKPLGTRDPRHHS